MTRRTEDIAAQVDALVERCRACGMNATPQRIVIYRALLESKDHPSPEVLFERVKAALPSVSLATIYKTLDTLVELGLAAEVPSTGDTKRYDGNMARHHHLVCTSCRRIEDYQHEELSRVPLPKGLPGFHPEFLSIHIHGLCRSCWAKAQA